MPRWNPTLLDLLLLSLADFISSSDCKSHGTVIGHIYLFEDIFKLAFPKPIYLLFTATQTLSSDPKESGLN